MPYLNKPTKPKRINTYNRELRYEVYNTSKWRELRLSKLIDQPLCEVCLAEGRTTLATQVHHMDSFMNYEGTRRLEVAYNYDNLQSICTECHSKLHAEEGRTNG